MSTIVIYGSTLQITSNIIQLKQTFLTETVLVRLFSVIIFLISPTVVSSTNTIQSKSIAKDRLIHMGGKFTYSIKLAGVRVGIQIITVGKETKWQGQEVYPLTSVEASTGLFDKFYRFRANRLTYISTNHLSPVFHRRFLEDKKYLATIEVSYDYNSETATHKKNGQVTKIHLTEGCQDELSWIYFLCHHPLKSGQNYNFPLLSKSTIRQARFHVSKETIKSKLLGKIGTLVITSESAQRKIWLSDDGRRLPVRIEAKLKVGRLVATLREIEPLAQLIH